MSARRRSALALKEKGIETVRAALQFGPPAAHCARSVGQRAEPLGCRPPFDDRLASARDCRAFQIAGVHTVDGLSDHAQASFGATPNGLALLDFCNSSRLELLNRTVPQLYKYVEA